MLPDPSRGAGALLTALVDAANVSSDATALLHETVTLHRLDGTSLAGRTAVAEAISHRGSEARFAIVGTYAEMIHVALVIDGVPGQLVFTMSAVVVDGVLSEIWMD